MSINQYHHILSEEDINYLLETNEVINAKKNIDSKNDGVILGSYPKRREQNVPGDVIYFTIPLNHNSKKMRSIKSKLSTHFGLHLDNIQSLPMRWIKGDTKPHMDRDLSGKSFNRTHLVYLTNNSGSLRINNESYPITQGSGYSFDEGLHHETIDTGIEPRLLLGPMSESCMAVGIPISVKTVIYRRVLHENTNYTNYNITYYSDNSALVQIYQKNMRTNCYQLVRSVNVPYCVSPVPYVPPTPPTPTELVIQSFTTSGITTWTAPPLTTSIEYLVVGGGGGGGGAFDTGSAGGGGAGLVLSGTISVTPNSTYNIYVGSGGAGGIGNRDGSPNETPGSSGENSFFNTIIATGGSGGYASRSAPGGGGVGGAIADSGTLTGGGGGNGGGSGGTINSAGGGGGNGSVGGTSVNNTPGVGGNGITSSISGNAVTYGVGADGGRDNTNVNGANGTVNSGNGGVGASSVSVDNSTGGNGGSGIVIIKYYQ